MPSDESLLKKASRHYTSLQTKSSKSINIKTILNYKVYHPKAIIKTSILHHLRLHIYTYPTLLFFFFKIDLDVYQGFYICIELL